MRKPRKLRFKPRAPAPTTLRAVTLIPEGPAQEGLSSALPDTLSVLLGDGGIMAALVRTRAAECVKS
jgi:hypothetical protein